MSKRCVSLTRNIWCPSSAFLASTAETHSHVRPSVWLALHLFRISNFVRVSLVAFVGSRSRRTFVSSSLWYLQPVAVPLLLLGHVVPPPRPYLSQRYVVAPCCSPPLHCTRVALWTTGRESRVCGRGLPPLLPYSVGRPSHSIRQVGCLVGFFSLLTL